MVLDLLARDWFRLTRSWSSFVAEVRFPRSPPVVPTSSFSSTPLPSQCRAPLHSPAPGSCSTSILSLLMLEEELWCPETKLQARIELLFQGKVKKTLGSKRWNIFNRKYALFYGEGKILFLKPFLIKSIETWEWCVSGLPDCRFSFSSVVRQSGSVSNLAHSLPENTTCSWTFQVIIMLIQSQQTNISQIECDTKKNWNNKFKFYFPIFLVSGFYFILGKLCSKTFHHS